MLFRDSKEVKENMGCVDTPCFFTYLRKNPPFNKTLTNTKHFPNNKAILSHHQKEISESKENKIMSTLEKIENAVVDGYKKIEDGVVGGYKKIEESVVGSYKKVEDGFVEKYLAKDGETVEEAKERITKGIEK